MSVQTEKSRLRLRPSQARAQQTITRLLDCAGLLLEKEGLEGFSTDKVAAEAGVAVGTLYRYFPDKSALMLAFVERWYTRENLEVDWSTVSERIDMMADWYRSEPGALAAIEAIKSTPALQRYNQAYIDQKTMEVARQISSSKRPTRQDIARARTLVLLINSVLIEATRSSARDAKDLIKALKELLAGTHFLPKS